MLRARPIMRSRTQYRVIRRRRRWQRVSWWFSLLLVIPLALILADWVFGWSPVDDDGSSFKTIPAVTFRVADADSGQPIAGAEVEAGTTAATTDERGIASLAMPAGSVVVTVRHAGYEPVFGRADGSVDREQTVSLRPLPPGQTEDGPSQPDTVAGQGAVGGGTDAAADDGAAGAQSVPAATAAGEDGGAAAGELTGRVTSEEGRPIKGALVLAGEVRARTKRDGSFRLAGGPDNGELVVTAPGYAKKRVPLSSESTVEIALARQQIKAVYLTGSNAADPAIVDRVIELADSTEINAFVVDIKEYYVWYDTGVQFFRDADAVYPIYDVRELVQRFHDRGIYAIARLVVFNDPLVAENRQDLAVKNEDGSVWRGSDDNAWVNPFNEELWQPNIDLAVEAAEIGFDEIQYDYVRFPSDGDLTTADFGPNYSEGGRVAAIVDFLKQSKAALEPTGAMLAADVFGIIAVAQDDQGIGQDLAAIARVVDYVNPMLYPSHFNANSIDVGGEPNDFPYETIQLSLAQAKDKMPGLALKLRPWLQDFSLGREYTADDVRAQIRASDEAGTSGWMLWNALTVYTEDALEPGP